MRIYKLLLILGLYFTLGFSNTPYLNNSILVLTSPQFYEPSFNNEWDQLNSTIINTSSKTIIINWGGYGGYDYIADRTIKAIEIAHNQGKTIVFKLNNDAISMHANVSCHADKIEFNGFAVIFHSGFYGHNKDGTKQYSNDRSYFNYCETKGLLNEEDITHIIILRERVEVYSNHKIYNQDYP